MHKKRAAFWKPPLFVVTRIGLEVVAIPLDRRNGLMFLGTDRR
jgi:hypothetical protein